MKEGATLETLYFIERYFNNTHYMRVQGNFCLSMAVSFGFRRQLLLIPFQIVPKSRRIVVGVDIKLGKIKIWHQVVFHMVNRILKGLNEFCKIFFVKKDFVLFIKKAVVFHFTLTLRNGKVVII